MDTRHAWLQSLFLAVLVGAGFGVPWMLVMAMIAAAVDAPETQESLIVVQDGTPLVLTYLPQQKTRRYRDLAGNVTAFPEGQAQLQLYPLPNELPPAAHESAASWSERICAFAAPGDPPVFWYFVTDGKVQGSAWFVGFDSESKTQIGFLGTGGFRSDELPVVERFPFSGALARVLNDYRLVNVRPYWTTLPSVQPLPVGTQVMPGFIPSWFVFLVTPDHRVYQVDLARRTVRVLREDSQLRSIGLVQSPSAIQQNLYRALLAVRQDNKVLLLDERGVEQRRYAIPEALRDRDLWWAETTRREAVFSAEQPRGDAERLHVYWVNPVGRTREEEVTLYHRPQPWFETIALGIAVPSPLVLDVAMAVIQPQEWVERKLAATAAEARALLFGKYRRALALAHAIGLVLAIACFRRQTRYAIRGAGRYLWPLFVLLLGLPGWVGYRFGRTWPVLERCPSCGSTVPHNREACARCGAEFPRPAPKGTEIFA